MLVTAPRELVIAYVLAIFIGPLGIHRFYLGRVASAFTMLALYLVSVPLMLLLGTHADPSTHGSRGP